MSTFKKLLALTLALAMVLSVSVFAGYKADTYKDAAGIDEDCEDAIELMYALEIMKGDTNGNFNPTATITRAEIAKMIYVILNYGKDDKAVNYTGAKLFSDVAAGAWYEGYVNYCGTTKLVQGRGNGTFGPNDPITCAEAAKMLLTAIGYSASDRGYTGANWDKNVLSDAAIIGLLDGYKYNTNTYAPRQWVAVMFENALTKALTYGTMNPVITGGLLTSITASSTDLTMGEKYYGLEDETGYLVSIEDAYLEDGVRNSANKKKALFVDGDNDLVAAVSGTGLGIADLGQEYRVIWGNDGVLSVRNTGKSVVGEATLKEITAEIVYDTENNRANNSYVFTIGDLEADFGKYEKVNGVKRDTIHYVTYAGGEYTILTAEALAGMMGSNSNDLVKAIDRDNDGSIDYAIVTDYNYARITKVSETRNGEFIEMEAPDQSEKAVDGIYPVVDVTWSGDKKLYLDDVIVADELEEGNYVKGYYSVEEDAYVLEVLEVIESATYDKKTNKGVYTFGGEKYNFAVEGFNTEDRMNGVSYEKEFDIVVDGDLIVYVGNIDKSYKAIDEINEQLALVYDWKYLDKIYTKNNPQGEDLYEIKYMTIDGEKHTAEYTLPNEYDSDDVLYAYETGKEIADWVDAGWRLFYLHTESDGTVWCEDLAKLDVHEDLNASEDLLDAYVEQLAGVKLDTKRNTLTDKVDGIDSGRATINPEMLLFVQYDTDKYKVCTLNDLADGTDSDVTIQVFYKENSRNVPVVLAGYIDATGLTAGKDYGYLYMTATSEDGFEKANATKDRYYANLTFVDGTVLENAVVEIAEPSEEVIYSYTYNNDTGRYALTALEALDDEITALYTETEEVEVYDDGKYDYLSVKDHVIAVTNFVVELDEAVFAQLEDGELTLGEVLEDGELDKEFVENMFIDFAELAESVIYDVEVDGHFRTEGDMYIYYTWYYDGAASAEHDDIFYVIQYKVQIEDQDNSMVNGWN